MLVLSRKLNEAIVIDGTIRVTVLDIRGSQVRLGFEAPDQIGIYREELLIPSRSSGLRAAVMPESGTNPLPSDLVGK